MNHLQEKNSIFEDISYGQHGFLFWIFLAGICLFMYAEILQFKLLLRERPNISEDYIMIWLAFIVTSLFCIYILLSIKYAFKTAQYISFSEEGVYFRFYFLGKIRCKNQEIKFISEFKPNKIMLQSDLFSDKPGLLVYLSNRKPFMISPNMENFVQVKELLEERLLGEQSDIHDGN